MTRRRWFLLVLLLVVIAAITRSYLLPYRVTGASDAPTYLVGDLLLVNKAAYDLRLPYTEIRLLSRGSPKHGDVVFFRPPDEEFVVFKRVVGCSGDRIVMRENRLMLNGTAMRYEPLDRSGYLPLVTKNKLGSLIENEIGNGPTHLVTHTPGASPHASCGPFEVPQGHYFLLGDNRDHSRDSRMYGAVPRESIIGQVVHTLHSSR